jgi:hypothetical protein
MKVSFLHSILYGHLHRFLGTVSAMVSSSSFPAEGRFRYREQTSVRSKRSSVYYPGANVFRHSALDDIRGSIAGNPHRLRFITMSFLKAASKTNRAEVLSRKHLQSWSRWRRIKVVNLKVEQPRFTLPISGCVRLRDPPYYISAWRDVTLR